MTQTPNPETRKARRSRHVLIHLN